MWKWYQSKIGTAQYFSDPPWLNCSDVLPTLPQELLSQVRFFRIMIDNANNKQHGKWRCNEKRFFLNFFGKPMSDEQIWSIVFQLKLYCCVGLTYRDISTPGWLRILFEICNAGRLNSFIFFVACSNILNICDEGCLIILFTFFFFACLNVLRFAIKVDW